jgi:hypothetical protein
LLKWLNSIIVILRTSLTIVYNKKYIVKIDSQNTKIIEPFSDGFLKEPLLNCTFSNDFFKEPLLNGSAAFLNLTSIFLLLSITFALMDCPSHRSLISIQRFKNKNLKTEIPRITNPFSSVFIYKKRDEREKEERKKREERQKK